jgi:hypothetical protein
MCALLLSVKSDSEESKGWSLSHGAFFCNEEVQQYVPPLVSKYVYDLVHNTGFVNVGIDHETAEFAVESIRRWWQSAFDTRVAEFLKS